MCNNVAFQRCSHLFLQVDFKHKNAARLLEDGGNDHGSRPNLILVTQSHKSILSECMAAKLCSLHLLDRKQFTHVRIQPLGRPLSLFVGVLLTIDLRFPDMIRNKIY